MNKPLKIVINCNDDEIYLGDNLWNHPEYNGKPTFTKIKDTSQIINILLEVLNRLDCSEVILEVINEDTRKIVYES